MAEENLNVDEQQAGGGEGEPVVEAVMGDEAVDPDEEKEKLPPPEEHLKTRYVPAIVTLLGTAVIAISCFIRQYPLMNMLVTVLLTILIFWFLGAVIKILLDKIVIRPKNDENTETEDTGKEEKEEKIDGAVIEK